MLKRHGWCGVGAPWARVLRKTGIRQDHPSSCGWRSTWNALALDTPVPLVAPDMVLHAGGILTTASAFTPAPMNCDKFNMLSRCVMFSKGIDADFAVRAVYNTLPRFLPTAVEVLDVSADAARAVGNWNVSEVSTDQCRAWTNRCALNARTNRWLRPER